MKTGLGSRIRPCTDNGKLARPTTADNVICCLACAIVEAIKSERQCVKREDRDLRRSCYCLQSPHRGGAEASRVSLEARFQFITEVLMHHRFSQTYPAGGYSKADSCLGTGYWKSALLGRSVHADGDRTGARSNHIVPDPVAFISGRVSRQSCWMFNGTMVLPLRCSQPTDDLYYGYVRIYGTRLHTSLS